MKIWLISQSENNARNCYVSAVVVARTVRDAMKMHPNESRWDESRRAWVLSDGSPSYGESTWCMHPNGVQVERIGDAPKNQEPRVVCASRMAGG